MIDLPEGIGGLSMRNRHQWSFEFNATELADAADRKIAHHTERLGWWNTEADAAEAQLRATGVEFREYSQTGGSRLDVVIDPGLSKRLSECKQKIEHHRDRLDEFTTYKAMFERDPVATFQLDTDDVRHFGLVGAN